MGDRETALEAVQHYRKRYSMVGLYENTLYANVQEGLDALRSCGHRLFVATSKPEVFATKILAHFEVVPYFLSVYGSKLDGSLSDKSALLAHALSDSGSNPRDSVMIGDREHDMIGAINNHMAAIGVLYGYGSKEELLNAGAERVFPQTRDLFQYLCEDFSEGR